MLQMMLSSMIMINNLIFMQMNHPLSMGLMLLLQTLMICLITGLLTKTFWFSYILFLIFLGGMLVLFIYVTSLASNEMFSFSMNILMISFLLLSLLTMLILFMDKSLFISFINNNEMNLFMEMNSSEENSITLNKLYNFPTNLITILLIIYLFITLIAIVKITNIFYGPLRPMS
uniref:NADH-ubiquinone oxidoreductase chain 6 n=1 Tax=Platypalpus longicornis TaxID=1446203 RepID=A0A7G7CDG6_9MUSC|nr:NADH dehydrogenase subunit 6 [Platypalpus longicornis]